MTKIIPIQTEFSTPREFINGGSEYDAMVHDLDFISDCIRASGVENVFMQYFVDRASNYNQGKHLSYKKIISAQKKGLFILYAMVLRDYLKLPLRNFQVILASCPLFQSFCGINSWACVNIPTFQKINTLENSLSDSLMKSINSILVKNVILDKFKTQKLGLEKSFNLNVILTDSTCMKANIHYPVDYVLMRDMIRTSMLKIEAIRNNGLKLRMPCKPKEWLSSMNSLIMEMSLASRRKDSVKKRKTIFRKMKKLFKQAMLHVSAYFKVFEKSWEKYGFTSLKAESIIITLRDILELKDEVVSIAHRRIIKGEKVESSDKILSIYEDDVNIITRNKDGSKVEFGNTLQFVEQEEGFIIDYDLLKEPSKGDAEGCEESIKRIIANYKTEAKSIRYLVGDKGYDAKRLQKLIASMNEEHNLKIKYDVMPRNPKELKEKMEDKKFKKNHKRRSSTEAKVAHIKSITDNPMKQKGIRNRKIHLGIAVFAHNLMKLARLHREQEIAKLKVS